MVKFDPQWSAVQEIASWTAMQLGAVAGPDGDREAEGLAAGQDAEDGGGADEGTHKGESLAELRKQAKNGNLLCALILGQSETQIEARMLCDVQGPTHASYHDEISQQKTQAGCALWEVAKASGGTLDECTRIAELLHCEALLPRYDMTQSGVTSGTDAGLHAVWHVEQRRAERFARLVLHQAAARSWTESFHCNTLPDMYAMALMQNEASAERGFRIIRGLWQAIQEVETYTGGLHNHVAKLMSSLGFHRHQLVREMMCIAEQNDWKPQSKAVQNVARRTFAVTGNTMFVAEDGFNELRDMERQSKNKAAARFTSYHALCTASVLDATDMPSVKPLAEDWQHALSVPNHLSSESIFFPGSHKPHNDLKLRTLQRGRTKHESWRKAGSASNAQSAAASAFLRIAKRAGKFDQIGRAWTGCLLDKVGLGIFEKETGDCYVSLGFQVWAALCWKLIKVPGGEAADAEQHASYFMLSSGPESPEFLVNFGGAKAEESTYLGLPLRVVVPGQQPHGGLHKGILFQQTGPPKPLLRHAVTQRVEITKDNLKLLCQDFGLPVKVKGPKKEDYFAAILEYLDLTDEEKASMLRGADSEDAECDTALQKAFDIMDAETSEDFKKLKAKSELSALKREMPTESRPRAEETGPRAPAQYVTPPSLKEFLPGGGEIPGIALYKNPVKQNFNAYYAGAPAGGPETCRRTWGFTTGRTMEQAMQLCVDWLETQHAAAQAGAAAEAEAKAEAQPRRKRASSHGRGSSLGRGRGSGGRGRGGRPKKKARA